MRKPIILFAALLMTAGYAWSMESDTYYLNLLPTPHSALVAFSIGYPKGWRVNEDSSLQRADVYNDIALPSPGINICSFNECGTNIQKNGMTTYRIWRSNGTTAKEAAEKFIASMKPHDWEKEKSLSPAKTSAGDSGWLVESEGYINYYPGPKKGTNAMPNLLPMMQSNAPCEKIPVVFHDFFFHVGNRGAIQIEITTGADKASWRSEMDQLVLQTLRFNEN